MTVHEPWSEVKEVFLGAVELDGDERRRFLRDSCEGRPSLREQVDDMLAAHESAHAFFDPGEGRLGGLLEVALGGNAVSAGDRVGSYRILRVIASGGMGVVYEAEQDNPRRRVALKLMRVQAATRSLRRRFEREARLLGQLEHPGIARIYEAGVIDASSGAGPEDAVPFFAMELVQGEALIRHAESRSLDRRARLELFIKVCAGAHHAHQRGIVHRDLKPANILVESSGQPKILDFGVARVSEAGRLDHTARTETGQLIGTLAYMSPEQVGADSQIDARSDVYALGVLLYELLTGGLPHELETKPIPEAARIIQEEAAPLLGRVDRDLRGDLETIVDTALAKEKERRYATADELAADLRRYLGEQPIHARPVSTAYVLRKFATRHRGVFTALTALLVTVVVASVVSLWFAFSATRERNQAVAAKEAALEAARQTDTANVFLMDLLTQTPVKSGMISTQGVIRRASALLDGDEPLHPAAEVTLRSLIGRGFMDLAQKGEAEPHLLRRAELARELHGEADDRYVLALQDLADVYAHWGRLSECREVMQGALAARRVLHGAHHMDGDTSSRLSWQVLHYAPESPEATAVWSALTPEYRRGGSSESPLPWGTRFSGPVILAEEFEGGALDPAWVPHLFDVADWQGGVGNSRLEVVDIRPSGDGAARVIFDRALEPLGDFRVACEIEWSSESSSEPSERAMHSVSIGLRWNDSTSADIGYGDGWIATTGRMTAQLRGRIFATDHGSMPYAGSARLELHRVAERVTVFWDELPFATTVFTTPLEGIYISFGHDPNPSAGGPSFVGTLAVHRMVVEGLPSTLGTPRAGERER